MTTYFTADQHFDHENIIKYVKRPFVSAQEMNEYIINAWNSRAVPGDTIHTLGDFTLANGDRAADLFSRLIGNIVVTPGGHDQRWIKDVVKHGIAIRSLDGAPVQITEAMWYTRIRDLNPNADTTLCHYPMLSWEKSHYGSIHLHGHTHGTIGAITRSGYLQLPPGKRSGFRVDVGVDNWVFQLLTAHEIRSYVNKSTLTTPTSAGKMG